MTAPIETPRATPTLERRRLWERRYRRRVRLTDITVVVTAVGGSQLLTSLVLEPAMGVATGAGTAGAVAAVWLLMLFLLRTRDMGDSAAGPLEYTRVTQATTFAFGLLAIVTVVVGGDGLRGQLVAALPLGLLGLLVGRWSWRKWLVRQRRFGHYVSRTIVVGGRSDVEYVLGRLADPILGYLAVGVVVTDGDFGHVEVDGRRVPVVGRVDGIARTAARIGADSIVVAGTPDGDPAFIKRLSWELEGTAAELVLSNRLADVAGPRISLRPVDGLPLIQVQIPRFEGGQFAIKRLGDVIAGALGLLATVIVGVPIAIAIRLTSRGPVLFRQERVGRDGETFTMLKFRTMHVGAERLIADLADANEGAGPLFKMRDDPRVTRVGRVLRRLSLDELPQLWNVMTGDMSLVGPRPPLVSEVVGYDGDVGRRLYIKPGLTGLWQISGRSDLSWEESVRLDLRYVENWSLLTDLMIMFRTVKAMVRPSGAY